MLVLVALRQKRLPVSALAKCNSELLRVSQTAVYEDGSRLHISAFRLEKRVNVLNGGLLHSWLSLLQLLTKVDVLAFDADRHFREVYEGLCLDRGRQAGRFSDDFERLAFLQVSTAEVGERVSGEVILTVFRDVALASRRCKRLNIEVGGGAFDSEQALLKDLLSG